jgi:nucleotide-binding universal stress UspA family protein
MSFKTILVHLDDSEHRKSRLDAAIRLAVDFGAQLVGVYLVAGTDLPPSVAAMLPPKAVERRVRELADAQHEAEQLFRQAAAAADVRSVDWRAPAGPPIAAAVAHGRCTDLLVMGQSDPGDLTTLFAEELVTTTMLSSGRPSLIVPYTGCRPTLGENVLIAWDGGREASRAVADALPILERAKQVNVLTVRAESDGHTADGQAAARLTAYLRAHGVDIGVNRSDVPEIKVGEWLLSRAADLGSDLIVMGGYGHARLREFVLGGVTRTMLQAMTVPVLMSH